MKGMSRNVTVRVAFLASTLLLVLVGCGGSGPERSVPVNDSFITNSNPDRGRTNFPIEFRKPIRREDGALAETLLTMPKVFVLSYRCDAEGRKSLVFSPSPPVATSTVWIKANGRIQARGKLDRERVEGPFVKSRYQSAQITQITSAQATTSRVYLEFEPDRCRVAGLNLITRREI